MLKVYAVSWCPHCVRTVEFLRARNIKFEYFELEDQPDEVVQMVIDANGGEDWVVPTLEFKGKWREGKIFRESELMEDLRALGAVQ